MWVGHIVCHGVTDFLLFRAKAMHIFTNPAIAKTAKIKGKSRDSGHGGGLCLCEELQIPGN
jgi:hypothetical protein